MRDDLSALFSKLLFFYKEKHRQIEIIATNEIQLRFFLQSDNISGFTDLLENDKDIFDTLDSIEFDIKSLREDICRISGIDKNNFERFFFEVPEEPIQEIKKFKEITDRQISDLIKERDNLITNMEKKLADIAIDINSLEKIRRLSSSTESGKK